MSNSRAGKNNTSKYEAAAGIGGGTLLVLLAKNLPDNNVLKSSLILVAPTISIVLSNF